MQRYRAEQTELIPELINDIEALCLRTINLRVQSSAQDLFETGALDSLSLVQLILELEKHFKIQLPLEELDIASLRSVEEIARLIERRRAATANPAACVAKQLVS